MFRRDYEFGRVSEQTIKPILERYFDDELSDTASYSQYDWRGRKNVYELKTRRNAYNKYPTTMIGADKVCDNAIFIFAFTDGIYYIPYDEEQFKEFVCQDFRRFRQGVRDVEKPYYYIPIECLRRIE